MGNINNKLIDIIDKYLNGELSETERIELETKLGKDPELRQFYEKRKVLVTGVRDYIRRQKVKKKLALIQEEYLADRKMENKRDTRIFLFRVIAASIFFLIVISFSYWFISGRSQDKFVNNQTEQELQNEDERVYKENALDSKVLLDSNLTVQILSPDKKTKSTTEKYIKVTIREYDLEKNQYLFENTDLLIIIKKGTSYALEKIEIIALTGQEQTKYLRIGQSFFQLQPTDIEQNLKEIQDDILLKILNQD